MLQVNPEVNISDAMSARLLCDGRMSASKEVLVLVVRHTDAPSPVRSVERILEAYTPRPAPPWPAVVLRAGQGKAGPVVGGQAALGPDKGALVEGAERRPVIRPLSLLPRPESTGLVLDPWSGKNPGVHLG
ncbi:hypothetical protein SKAU_G00151470 [Synaphobranchus kaupii]|uniref:Uncharacterized protein n=1 Tax=Synaphobranchus kaupii TaxID=118154 RepID=A0A9Q1IZ01_SYNKA|nr:hypothetical protein SKAU_G00151470 [Synaphobranchus kaupii]